ncbi:hypothetical protein A9Q87_01210 [Flavobacteriales bacterium 34_180_T64]|nr:hypothetical protein A9Q87_01210 [Flavobacteriales bacterium 34_180_T64]
MSSFSQLVNIESQRIQSDSIRFVFSNHLSFSYYNTNGSEVFQISDGLSTQLKSKDLKKIYLLLGNYSYVRASEQNFNNTWFLHFRFNYKITDLWRFETFVQSQYNEFLDINSRNLFGIGARLKLVSKEHVNLYFGNAYMYEYEKSMSFETHANNHRNSSYLSFNAKIPMNPDAIDKRKVRNIFFLNTIYYQPLYEDFSNYIISELFRVEVPMTQHLSMTTQFTYYYDSLTPSGNKQYVSNMSFGFGLNF